MDWFYAKDGKQVGPINDDQLRQLVEAGQVDATTLVWNEGLPDWTAYGTVQAGVPLPPAPAGLKVAYREQATVTGDAPAAWQSGSAVVVPKDGSLPPRCIRCNEPVEGDPILKKVYYYPPWLIILVLFNLLIMLIVALLVRKSSTVNYSVCERHKKRRKVGLAVGWSMFFLSIVLIGFGIAKEMGELGLAGFVLLLVSPIVGISMGRLFYASKMDEKHVWLSGCGKTFRASLPQFHK